MVFITVLPERFARHKASRVTEALIGARSRVTTDVFPALYTINRCLETLCRPRTLRSVFLNPEFRDLVKDMTSAVDKALSGIDGLKRELEQGENDGADAGSIFADLSDDIMAGDSSNLSMNRGAGAGGGRVMVEESGSGIVESVGRRRIRPPTGSISSKEIQEMQMQSVNKPSEGIQYLLSFFTKTK